MLVDDNDTDNFISKRIVEITKFAKRVEVKNSGKSALDYLTENQNIPENLPNIIFLDINMPVVDGFVFLYEFENSGKSSVQNARLLYFQAQTTKGTLTELSIITM